MTFAPHGVSNCNDPSSKPHHSVRRAEADEERTRSTTTSKRATRCANLEGILWRETGRFNQAKPDKGCLCSPFLFILQDDEDELDSADEEDYSDEDYDPVSEDQVCRCSIAIMQEVCLSPRLWTWEGNSMECASNSLSCA